MLRVWQADERESVNLPIPLKTAGSFRADSYNFGIPLQKTLVVTAQLCQVEITKWSGEAPVENQDHI